MRKNDNKNTKLIFHPDNIKQYKNSNNKHIPFKKIIASTAIIFVFAVIIMSPTNLYPIISHKDFQILNIFEYYNYQKEHRDKSTDEVVSIVNDNSKMNQLGYNTEEYLDYVNKLDEEEINFIMINNINAKELQGYMNISNFKLGYYYDYENIRTTNEWTHQETVNFFYYPNFLSADYKNTHNILNLDENLMLVNKVFQLESTYEPNDLVFLEDVNKINPDETYRHYLRKVAYNALKEMFNKAERENIYLYSQSAYRSYDKQNEIYNRYVRLNGKLLADTFSARPGHSEHQTGLAVDVNNKYASWELDETFGETKEGKWIAQNAHNFGFIIRYPKEKENITGYKYEPWHLRYVGKDVAKIIYEENLTLEEYILRYVSLPTTK